MTHVGRVVAAVSVVLGNLVMGVNADAVDQGIGGKKLLLKTTPKLVLLSKDPSLMPSFFANPVSEDDSFVAFVRPGGPAVSFGLPANLWSNTASGGFTYKNRSAPTGPSPVKIAKVRDGFLKVVAKGLPFPVPNGAGETIDVVFSLDGGTNTWCMSFTSTGDGSKYLAKDAGAPSSCAPVCGGGFQGDQTACYAYSDPQCRTCCDADTECAQACAFASNLQCIDDMLNEACTVAVNAACSEECCAPAVCGNGTREVGEACDGADAGSCPSGCRSDCTCAVCGDNSRDGTEQCDGTDDSACPGDCISGCTCAPACPQGGSGMACTAYASGGACRSCCDGSGSCASACQNVWINYGCTAPALNDYCSAQATAAGCAVECCTP